MRLGALAFLAGILLLHALPELPSRAWSLALPAVLGLLWRIPWLRWPAWSLAGFLWALLLATPPQVLPAEAETVDWQVIGWIASPPQHQWRSTGFEVVIQRAWQGQRVLTTLAGRRVQLRWWHDQANTSPRVGPPLTLGDRWQFTVRLKALRGLHNPGGFDRTRSLYARGIAATGTVRLNPPPQQQVRAERYRLDRYRQRVAASFARQLPDHPALGVLSALAVGDESGISSEQWALFNRLGVSHLLSISGAHIGLVAGLAFALVWGMWSRMPRLVQRWPAAQPAAIAALVSAAAYTLLSGAEVPAQRALLMATVALGAVLLQRPAATSRGLALALWVVLIWEPAAPLRPGFWLSFGAVTAILYSLSGPPQDAGRVQRIIRAQWAVTVALIPPILIFFQQIPLLSPVANIIAIPWVGSTVLPLSLLAALLEPLGGPAQAAVLHVAALTVEGLWRVLFWLDRWPGAVLAGPAPPLWTLGFALPGVALLLAPAGLPGRWLGVPLCLPLIWPPLSAPLWSGFWFTLLDTGQGLAAVVRTHQHVLVYDTGPRLGAALDAGQAVLTPFLRQQGVKQVDLLIVSHDDRHHTGGVRSLREHWPVTRLLTSDPQQTPLAGAQACRAGQRWNWDGVEFHLLHPPSSGQWQGSNGSCVLKVESQAGRVLLPGDIERPAETALVTEYGTKLAAEILVAPHHGHRNLSTEAFLQAVQPRYVLFATGYGNRFNYPRPETVARYQMPGVTLLNTAEDGAITFRLEPGQSLTPERSRRDRRHYWNAP